MLILGGLDDQLTTLVWQRISNQPFSFTNQSFYNFPAYKYTFLPFINPLLFNEPLSIGFVSVFSSIFGGNFYNISLVLTIVANFLGSYLLFKRFKFGYLFALIYTFSSYMWLHLGIHFSLAQIWVFPVFISLMLWVFESDKKLLSKSALLGVYIFFVITISNYNGFFILVLFSAFVLSRNILSLAGVKRLDTASLKVFLVSLPITLVLSLLVLLPYIKSTYFQPKLMAGTSPYKLVRPLSDFVIFSSRPWYFFIPSTKSPVYSFVSTKVVSALQNTGYFLAGNYFEGEHAASFFGFGFYILLILTLVLVYRSDKEELKRTYIWFLTAFVISLFMLPTLFTIHGITIWTPNYLIYRFFPMFRSTARLSSPVLLCLLLVVAQNVTFLSNKGKLPNRFSVLLAIIAVFILIETFIPMRVYSYNNAPEVYTYLRDKTPLTSVFAVYPYSRTRDGFFWLPVHERLLANPRGYANGNFDSEKFTKDLGTAPIPEEQGLNYLIVYKDTSVNLTYFEMDTQLSLIKDFSDSLLFKVNR